MTLQAALTLAFGIAGLSWYYVSLFGIGWTPPAAGSPVSAFRQFMSLSVTTIGVSLATFVGMLLGVRSVSESVQQSAPVAAALDASPQLNWLVQGTWITSLQWWAAGLYVLSLLIAIWLWRRGGDATDPAVSNLAKSLLGLIGGALSIALNLSPAQ